jgi:hypothetical protein
MNIFFRVLVRIANINPTPNNSTLTDDIIDASILAGLTFFTNLASQAVISNINIIQAGIQAGLMFFTFLAIKRGLIISRKK